MFVDLIGEPFKDMKRVSEMHIWRLQIETFQIFTAKHLWQVTCRPRRFQLLGLRISVHTPCLNSVYLNTVYQTNRRWSEMLAEQKVIARERLKAGGFKQPHIVKRLIMISHEK